MKINYIPVYVEATEFCSQDLICASPTPGGNEDVGYEDWGTIIVP